MYLINSNGHTSHNFYEDWRKETEEGFLAVAFPSLKEVKKSQRGLMLPFKFLGEMRAYPTSALLFYIISTWENKNHSGAPWNKDKRHQKE